MKHRIPGVLSLWIAAILVGGCNRQSVPAPPAAIVATNVTLTAAQRQTIRLETVKTSAFRGSVETTGTVGFDNDQATTVLAPISGPASKLLVNLGETVKAGEPLALIDSPDFAAAIAAYRKGVVTAKNARRIASLDEELFKVDAIARRDVEQAEADVANAEADRDAALAQLHSLGVDAQTITNIQQNLPVTNALGVIRSPIDGAVVEKLITPGQLLQSATTPCFTVADISRMWIIANVFESDLGSIQVGDPVELFTGAAAGSLPGAVDNISAIIDPNTRAVGVRVVAPNPGGVLKKQMFVRVVLHSSRERSGVLAPVASALRDSENLPFVYVARQDGAFERRHITLGPRVGDQYEVVAGLAAGEQIVTDGGLFVQFLQNQ
jgi:cobalt-zinc-cadmium efflux system membrane fusion protein